jgi:RNA polymerase-binding transcription factor DksA
MTQLEYDIKELEDKRKSEGLSCIEKLKLQQLQDQWLEIESAQYGACLSCYI